VVLAIIALLSNLSYPAFATAIRKAQSMKCAANLRQIGISVTLAAADNNNQYPEIDQAASPVYTPPGPNLLTVLGPYGVSTQTLQCPTDMALGPASSFSNPTYGGSSYEWDPVFDDESLNATVVYIRPTVKMPVSSGRARLCMDYVGLHRGRPNVLYGDGHVTSH